MQSITEDKMVRLASLLIIGLWTTLLTVPVIAATISLPYSGRLVEDDAKPVVGPVDIVVEFYKGESGGESVSGPHTFPAITLEDGVFQLNIALESAEFHKIFKDTGSPAWIQITEATHGVVYPRQLLAATPYALKVPVDNTTVGWNDAGQLKILDGASVNKVAGQTFQTSGASQGQVLAWDAGSSSWKPASAGSGSASAIVAGTGLVASDTPLTIKGHTAQSGNLTEWKKGSTTTTVIDENGRLGIGATNPSTKIEIESVSAATGATDGILINQLGAGDAAISFKTVGEQFIVGIDQSDTNKFKISDGSDFGTDRIVIDSAGSVGIATTTPAGRLHVEGPFGTLRSILDNYVDSYGNADSSGNEARFQMKRSRGTFDSPTILQDNDRIGRIKFIGHDGTGYVNGAEISTFVDGVPGVGDLPTRMTFATSPDGTTAATERMRITNAGYVGIGGTAPLNPLVVTTTDPSVYIPSSVVANGPVNGNGISVFNESNTNGSASYIRLSARDIGNRANLAYIGVVSNAGLYTPDIVIGQRTGNTAFNERLRITKDGNVGIGTIAPNAILDVIGSTSSGGIKSTNTSAPGTGSGGGFIAVIPTMPTAANQRLGGYFFGADDGTNYYNTSVISSFSTEAYSPTNRGSDIRFSTTLTGAIGRQDRMVINGDGNVGIGTPTPQSTLQVNGYVQLALTSGAPPPGDCDAASERGRMKVDNAAGLLYICMDSGWVSK